MSIDSEDLPQRLQKVLDRISAAASAAGREPRQVQLVAVSKTRPPEALRALYAAGQRAFGENYLQEARDKQEALQDLDIEWHFIGPIQSNKTRIIAEHFDWVHSVDRLKIAQRLAEQRPAAQAPLNICLQVNIDREASKSGVMPDALPELVAAVSALPRLRLKGLMAIPAPQSDYRAQLEACLRLRDLQQALNAEGYGLDSLSMGMSADLEAAIAAGATLVRIGTDIFGPRGI